MSLAWPLVVLTVSLLVLWRVDRWALARGRLAPRTEALEHKLDQFVDRLEGNEVDTQNASARLHRLDDWSELALARIEKLEEALKVSPPAPKRHSEAVLKRFK